ncbi:MAG: GNAT family N-acetyltransferase [Armatimonadota bacterium]|nr:GNAT family N-acetyltransferase [Armatimonadota bacterium]MDR7451823.1 GNAT family N-acetyltransferase [Armatimonadota bacterium]MDR7467548.1 GNAT family N-acetyltransferase [Armatimonadota bacterium]MDR7494491.1 GNAT family N-acetyltransferase [Armatimonadota bacterium]MDR7499752.1 GNAT family N-acetyltransferase [Armatimonadota bacterium]
MAQIAEHVDIRPLCDADFAAVAEIYRANFPDVPLSAAEVRDRYRRFDEARFVREWVIAEERGRAAGYGFHAHLPWSFHPDKYQLFVAVHPQAHRRGIGTALMRHHLRRLEERGARRVKSWAREDYAHAVAFLRGFGFDEYARVFESRLAVTAVDLAPFAASTRRVAEAGVTITTLKDELRRDPQCLGAVYQAHGTLDLGAPREDPDLPTPPSFERFVDDEVRHPQALLDAFFLVKKGDLYVGESALKRSESDPGVLWQQLTAVLPEYRGLGIATALKLRTVEYAQVMGYREIRTFNSSRNAPMLAINAKLGFVRQPAWIDFLRVLRA